MSDSKVVISVDKAIGSMLGAAFGDALGWPNERFAKPRNPNESLSDLAKWLRKSGGRFYPYEEIIGAGEYSDDTQLILAVGRSLLSGDKWWDRFTRQELPFWSFYERGGGGATKRAVAGWLIGAAPWLSAAPAQNAKRYFDAGGNGVAMRILPHVIFSAGEERFGLISKRVLMDGLATHGHPRALVGAIAYAYALWISLRHEGRLEYGELIAKLVENVDSWSQLPNISQELPDWKLNAERYVPRYADVWKSAVYETIEYLKIAKDELSKGVLVSDDAALRRLHCFDNAISGAGTVAAVASVYLASRYAPNPINGVVKAAYAIGADTDTIASMTGGLLGAVCGASWISSNREKIQDSKYLTLLAQKLVAHELDSAHRVSHVNNIAKWVDVAFSLPNEKKVISPIGVEMTVYVRETVQSKSGKFRVEQRKFVSSYGQTFFFNKIMKKDVGDIGLFSADNKKSGHMHGGAKLISGSLERSKMFYAGLLGLKVKKETEEMVVFEQGLVIVPQGYNVSLPGNIKLRALMYTQVAEIDSCFVRVEKAGVEIVTRLTAWGNSPARFFRCFDPDGNIVEVFSRNPF